MVRLLLYPLVSSIPVYAKLEKYDRVQSHRANGDEEPRQVLQDVVSLHRMEKDLLLGQWLNKRGWLNEVIPQLRRSHCPASRIGRTAATVPRKIAPVDS